MMCRSRLFPARGAGNCVCQGNGVEGLFSVTLQWEFLKIKFVGGGGGPTPLLDPRMPQKVDFLRTCKYNLT